MPWGHSVKDYSIKGYGWPLFCIKAKTFLLQEPWVTIPPCQIFRPTYGSAFVWPTRTDSMCKTWQVLSAHSLRTFCEIFLSKWFQNNIGAVFHQANNKTYWFCDFWFFATSRKCKRKHAVMQKSESDFEDWNLWKTKIYFVS